MRWSGVVERGFTMVELLVAMAIFSFMLMIIVVGFVNVIRMHNEAISSNVAQDNARTAMDELVRAVRNSHGVASISGVLPQGVRLCLDDATGQKLYFIRTVGTNHILTRGDTCAAVPVNMQALTNDSVQVTYFEPVETTPPGVNKPEVDFTITVASNNGTTIGAGNAVQCRNNNYDREFCSVVTLTSGAVPR